jgi:NAD(P)-dependent dehydrogenase (short-subunit alcohol dehydrogenase family)
MSVKDLFQLDGKVALITGGSRGLGLQMAEALGEMGCRVAITARKADELAEAKAHLQQIGIEVQTVVNDLQRFEGIPGLVDEVLGVHGRIDILVNNAGTTKFATHADLESLSAEDFADIYAVNVIGPFQMIRACRDALKASGDGAIVNVSSIAAMAGIGSSVAYAASKGALNTMTLSLARALAPEIRVNAVCPGYVTTPWFTQRFGEEASNRLASGVAAANPLKRVAAAEDIALTIVFLASAASFQITGETLLVDSGTHLTIAAPPRI